MYGLAGPINSMHLSQNVNEVQSHVSVSQNLQIFGRLSPRLQPEIFVAEMPNPCQTFLTLAPAKTCFNHGSVSEK